MIFLAVGFERFNNPRLVRDEMRFLASRRVAIADGLSDGGRHFAKI